MTLSDGRRLEVGGQVLMRLPSPSDTVPLPATLGDCRGQGLCPKLACRFNVIANVSKEGTLYIGGGTRGGSGTSLQQFRSTKRKIQWSESRADVHAGIAVRHLDPLPSSCAIDYAEDGDLMPLKSEARDISEWGYHMTVEQVAAIDGVSRQRIDIVIKTAIAKIARALGVSPRQAEHRLRLLAAVTKMPGWAETPDRPTLRAGVSVRKRTRDAQSMKVAGRPRDA